MVGFQAANGPIRTIGKSVAACAVVVLLAGPATATLGSILDDTGLTPADIEMATAAAETLYARSGVKPGDSGSWENPETGAKGVVEVTGVDGAASCVSFRHLAEPASYPVRKFDMKRCKDAQNIWVLVPE